MLCQRPRWLARPAARTASNGRLVVDLGYASRERVESFGIHPGTRIVLNPPTRKLGDTIVGKAMDDRAALAIATSVAERADVAKLRYELWIGSTVQEENGLLGASSIAELAPFDYGIALDVGLCGDVPGTKAENHPAKLGGGPLLCRRTLRPITPIA